MGKAKRKGQVVDEDGFIVVNSWDEVPDFQNEAAEAAFWGTHTLGEALLDTFAAVNEDERKQRGLPPTRLQTSSKTISLRLEQDVLGRLKAVARKKRVGYQTLLKEFVLERLYEEEKREGLI